MDSKRHFPHWLENCIVVLIVLNVLSVIMESVASIEARYHAFFYYFELFSVSVFTVEYITRLYFSVKEKHSLTNAWRFVKSPLGLVDLFAILPFYLPLLFPIDLRFIRILRVFRILRIIKLKRYGGAFDDIIAVIRSQKEELVITLSSVIVLLVISSAFMFHVEHDAQPDKFSSIPQTMWWGVITLTSVGYGDIYPITPFGKFLGSIISLLGIAMFGLPAGIIASGFTQMFDKKKARTHRCPKCNHEFSENK